MRALGLGVFACFVMTGAAQAQNQAQTQVQGLEGLGWLTGCWIQKSGDRTVEEHWTDASGGIMLETGRTVKGGLLRDYEFARIAVKGGVLTFTADPMDQPEASFTVKSQTVDAIEFENLSHDFPKHVRYRSTGKNSLHAEIDGPKDPAKANGDIRTIGWDYTRCVP